MKPSIHHTVYPEGWEPAAHKSVIFWFEQFIKWFKFIKTNQCQL